MPGTFKPASKKRQALSREVQALAEEAPIDAAPLVPTHAIFREKRNVRPTSKWEWKPFYNSAREDGVIFHHWAKKDDNRDDYVFARFNKKPDVVQYTPEEYTKLCHDPNWTREQTDQLFELCRRFDLRFHVIHDRFEYRDKTIEDLKARYYGIARKLLEAKNDSGSTMSHPIVKTPYNREYEKRRRQQYEKLYWRSRELVEEEHALAVEMRKINLARKKQEKEAIRARKTMGAVPDSGAPQRGSASRGSATGRDRKRKSSFGGSGSGQEVAMPQVKKVKKEVKKPKVGVSMRSEQLLMPTSVGNKMSKSVTAYMDKLDIPKRPMATEAVVNAYNDLRNEVMTLLEVQKACRKAQELIDQQKSRKERALKGRRGA